MKYLINNKRKTGHWLPVFILLSAAVFLAGCQDGGTAKATVTRHEVQQEKSLFSRFEESLGVIAQNEPGRGIKGALVACGSGQGAIEDWGLAIGRLPGNMKIVYVVWSEKDIKSGHVFLPLEDEWDCPMGKMKLNVQNAQILLQKNKFCQRESLNDRQREQLALMSSLLLLKYGEIEIVPLFAATDVSGKILCSSLLRMLSDPKVAVVSVLPGGYAEENAGWREQVHKRHGGGAVGVLPNVCDMMCMISDGYALNLFDLHHYPSPAPPRPAKFAPAPVRRRIESMVFLETSDSKELMNMLKESSWDEANMLEELTKQRGQLSGKRKVKLLNHVEEWVLLDFVRKVMICRLAKTEPPEMPQYSKTLLGNYGCSITLRRDGKVLGTVSQMPSGKPLPVLLVVNATKLTADEKHPVTLDDMRNGQLEIGVITPATRLSYKSAEDLYRQLKPGQHGVILRAGGKSAGFVPVVWKSTPDPRTFMAALCRRCGQTEAALTAEGTEVSVFEVHTFKEDDTVTAP